MPLLSTRGSVSDFALGFFSQGGKFTAWVYNAFLSVGLTNYCVTDSAGNTYWCLCRSDGTYIQKTSIDGTLIWSQQISNGLSYWGKTYIALDTAQTTLWLCQETTRANGANYVTELRAISSADGSITNQGKYYYASGYYGRVESMQFSEFATDGKKIVITLTGKLLRLYPNVYGSVVLLVDPTNLSSYRYAGTFCPGNTTSFISISMNGTVVNGGNAAVLLNSSAGYGVLYIDSNGDSAGSYGSPSGARNNACYSYGDYLYADVTGGGSLGITQYQANGGINWSTRAVITGATTSTPASNVKTVWVDSGGNIFTACGIKNSTGVFYIAVLKVNSSGTVQWVKKLEFSLGDAYAMSVSGGAGCVSITCQIGPNPYVACVTLKDDGSNINGNYVAETGSVISISSPAYTTNTSFNVVGMSQNKYEMSPASTPVSISGVSSITGTTITKTLLPYS